MQYQLDAEQDRFLQAICDARYRRGTLWMADARFFAETLGIDPVGSKPDRDHYHEVMDSLRDAGYLEQQTHDAFVRYATTRLTESGLAYCDE